MLLRLPITHEFSGSIGYIEKEINDNYLNTYYTIEDFLGHKLDFKIEKEAFEESTNTIIVYGIPAGILGYLATSKYYCSSGFNLKMMKMTPNDFKDNILKVNNLGFKVVLDEPYFSEYAQKAEIEEKRKLHNSKRNLFQKILGLNRFKKSNMI